MSKTILITGSSRGIGAILAKLAVNDGYEVIIHGRKLSRHLKLIAKQLGYRFLSFDVNNEKEIKRSLKGIKKIDIL